MTTAGPSDPSPSASLWALGLLGVLFVALCYPIFSLRLDQFWNDPRYSHCLLVPLVSGLWIYDRWPDLRDHPAKASGAGVVAAVLCVLLYLYTRLLHVNIGQHVSAMLLLAALVWALAGRGWLRRLAFPFGYLALTVPLPKTWDDALTLPLQRMATVLAEGAFDTFGWPVLRRGNVLEMPNLKLLVEEQCSGAHSLYALLALGLAWVFFMPRPTWLRVLLVVCTGPIALLANAIRVIGTGALAYKVDPKYAEGASHFTGGMIVFTIGVALFLTVDWCLRPDAPDAPEEAGDAAPDEPHDA